MNSWLEHVKRYREKHPGMKYSDCLKNAKSTYKKKAVGKGVGVSKLFQSKEQKEEAKKARRDAKFTKQQDASLNRLFAYEDAIARNREEDRAIAEWVKIQAILKKKQQEKKQSSGNKVGVE